jgi:LysR family transcriptional regulator AphB
LLAGIDGLGVAVLPDYMCREEVNVGKLVKILPNWRMIDLEVYALYPRNRAKIPKVKAFLDFVVTLYADILKTK